MSSKIYSKQEFIDKLIEISEKGWIYNYRKGNSGSVGNLLEDLLNITENNLPIPNSAEWELKAQRVGTSSLTTLFHFEPSPRSLKFVPNIFLPLYGWAHKDAGVSHPNTELSFRQTIHGKSFSDRGFKVAISRKEKKVTISFAADNVSEKHKKWLESVDQRTGLGEIDPQPYWGFDDLEYKAGTKLTNCFLVKADAKKENDQEFFHYSEIVMLQNFCFQNFLNEIDEGNILVDFDARTGHNHGTKFRVRQFVLPNLYSIVTPILSNT